MTAQPTTPWGQTLKTAARMGQEKRGGLTDPMPGFFHQKPTPDGKAQILHSHEVDARVKTLVQVKERAFSPEFMRAITLEDGDELQSTPAGGGQEPLRQRSAVYDGPQNIQQGVVFRMNRFSLVALIVGLLFLGLMFFAGGIMLAFNFSSQEASQGPAAAPQQAQDHSRAINATRELVTLLPSGAQGTVSRANQVGNVAQVVAAPAPGAPAQAAPSQTASPVAGASQAASAPAAGASQAASAPAAGQPHAAGSAAAPAPALGAMPGARSSAAAPAVHPAVAPGAPPPPAAVTPPATVAPVGASAVAPVPLAQASAAVAPVSAPAAVAPMPVPLAPVAAPVPPAPLAVSPASTPTSSTAAVTTPVAPTPPVTATAAPVAQAPIAAPTPMSTPSPQQTSTPAPAAITGVPVVSPAPAAPQTVPAPRGTAQPAGQQKAALEKPVDATALTRPFALQVGAYSTVQKAQQVVALLHRRGYNAYVVSLPLAGQGKDFAVRMGGYFTRQSALVAANHLMRKERFKIMAIAKNNAERVIL